MFKKFEARDHDWKTLLPHYGVSPDFLRYTEGPCPICGGKKRFRYKDKGVGDWFCNHCRGGDGLSLVAKVNSWTIAETIRHLNKNDRQLVSSPQVVRTVAKEVDRVDAAAYLGGKWSVAKEIRGTAAERYLKRRVPGLDVAWLSADLRFAMLWYKNDQGKLYGRHPCLVARVQDVDGNGISLHRTYLTEEGVKAFHLGTVKKLMSGVRKLDGDAIVLNNPAHSADTLIISEGIETGLALVASTQNRLPAWSLINASNLGKCRVPRHFRKVIIGADRDALDQNLGYRPGEHYAEKLAIRLRGDGFEVVVKVPEMEGVDFCDLWAQKFQVLQAA